MRFPLVLALVLAPIGAQAQRLSSADSALVAKLLLAEEHRDTSRTSYAAGLSHADARVRTIAQRGLWRSLDASFANRDSLPALPAPPKYDDPAWRLRFRALGRENKDCGALRVALADSAWPVRLRAADLVTGSCATDAAIVQALKEWAYVDPTDARRPSGGVSWHPTAHALTALARISPNDARPVLAKAAKNPVPQLRTYAVAAAATLGDIATLHELAGDVNDNVKEAAIAALAKLTGHADDTLFISALSSRGYQAVRAAANALKGSPRQADVLHAAIVSATRLRHDSSETSRDARSALADRIAELAAASDWSRVAPLATDFDCQVASAIAAIGKKFSVAGAKANCAPMTVALPPDAVSLALGADVRLKVTMADSSGGGSFVVKLRGDVAPVMAARVLDMARRGWYNGRPWHRVEPDFVTQGGGGGTEYIGYPRFFRDELGTVPHARGTIGMSTRGHDTGDGQWFFNLRDNFRLNKDYTVFAEVTDGIAVVDGILEGDVIGRIEVLPARQP